ncbi:VOC family protein [Tundrisphaera sp. TA3]|uniref:VOC family protein n=1 Tax=Tundrisphaera sp. TA3 TaxID=3435775 RepID=UPI003EC0D8D3
MAKIEHFALFAADPGALKDFYVAALGLRVAVDNSGATPPGYFLADDHGMALEIIGRPAGVPGADTRYICHVAFVVEDFAPAKAALEKVGMVFETDSVVDNATMTTAFFRDPEGNRVQIVRRPAPLLG